MSQQYVLKGLFAYTAAFEPGILQVHQVHWLKLFFAQIVDDGTAAWSAVDRLGSN